MAKKQGISAAPEHQILLKRCWENAERSCDAHTYLKLDGN